MRSSVDGRARAYAESRALKLEVLKQTQELFRPFFRRLAVSFRESLVSRRGVRESHGARPSESASGAQRVAVCPLPPVASGGQDRVGHRRARAYRHLASRMYTMPNGPSARSRASESDGREQPLNGPCNDPTPWHTAPRHAREQRVTTCGDCTPLATPAAPHLTAGRTQYHDEHTQFAPDDSCEHVSTARTRRKRVCHAVRSM